jgi:hypothetical protein
MNDVQDLLMDNVEKLNNVDLSEQADPFLAIVNDVRL